MSIISDANHGIIGDEFGHMLEVFFDLDAWGDGGTNATIDGINALLTKGRQIFDNDTTGEEFLSQYIGSMNRLYYVAQTAKVDLGNLIRQWIWQRLKVLCKSTGMNERDILGDWAEAMSEDSKSVLSCAVAVGATTAKTSNVGNCTIVTSTLDRWNRENNDIQNQDFDVVCTDDAETGGQTAYAEKFSVAASISGQIGGLYAIMVPGNEDEWRNRLQNEDGDAPGAGSKADATICFENFTADLPDCWTHDVGTAGTTYLECATEYYFGTKSLQFVGDAVGLLNKIHFNMTDGYGSTATNIDLHPYEHYIIGTYMKGDAGATGIVKVYFSMTGYTASGDTERAYYDFGGGALASWTLKTGIVRMPASINVDAKIYIECTEALENTKNAYLDGVFFARMYFWEDAGINISVVPGSTASRADDQRPDWYIFSSTNDKAGRFNAFMGLRTDSKDPKPRVYPDIQISLPHSGAPSAQYLESKAGV